MALEFEFPDTGEGVTEGTFLEWLVDTGEEVEEDQAVAEVETDKAVVDVPAPTSGTIKELRAEPGDTVNVGDVILVMNTGDEAEEQTGAEPEPEDSGESSEAPSSEEEVEETAEEEPETEEAETGNKTTAASSPGNVLALPKVRKLARDKGVDLASIKTSERITEDEVLEAAGSASETEEEEKVEETAEPEPEPEKGQETENEDSETSPSSTGKVLATPAVRKLAREEDVDITAIEGSGRGGKVTREDVMAVANGETPEKAEEVSKEEEPKTGEKREVKKETKSADTGLNGGEAERVQMSNIRKTIASRMENSKFTAPHVTHIDTADVTRLVELRNEEKEKVDAHLTYMPFIMKATVLALQKFPDLNAELDEEKDEVIRYGNYDFNIAVDTEDGLMVPVIREVDDRSILDLADAVVEKAEQARNGELSAEDMENGTFSITNVGVIGGEAFTPIINHPQVAILGVGKISETAEVVDGEVVPRHTVTLSLSYDHRVVDGATAARFMNEIIENLEDPEKMLMAL